jgi:hypothetical protein
MKAAAGAGKAPRVKREPIDLKCIERWLVDLHETQRYRIQNEKDMREILDEVRPAYNKALTLMLKRLPIDDPAAAAEVRQLKHEYENARYEYITSTVRLENTNSYIAGLKRLIAKETKALERNEEYEEC